MSLASDRTIRGLVDIMSTHDEDHSEHFWRKVAGRLHAFGPRVTQLLADEPEERERPSLRQNWTADLEDVDWWAEHVHHLRREYEDAAAIFERVRAHHAPPQLRDRDEDAAQEDSDRISREVADERAADQAPRVAS